MHGSIPTTHTFLIFVFFFHFLSFSFLFYLYFICSPSILLYCSQLLLFILSTMVGFIILPLNYFWLLIGVLLRLSIGLLAIQPLPLLWIYWLHHSPFLDKIACLISYLSLFFTTLIQIRIKPLRYLPLWHASSGSNPHLLFFGWNVIPTKDGNFAPPRKGGGVGMWRDFSPAPRGGVGMGFDLLDLTRPADKG